MYMETLSDELFLIFHEEYWRNRSFRNSKAEQISLHSSTGPKRSRFVLQSSGRRLRWSAPHLWYFRLYL